MKQGAIGVRWVAATAVIWAGAVFAFGDEPPNKKDASGGETPPWSEPTAPPVGQSGSDPLPPPRVVVRRGSRPNPPTDAAAAAMGPRIKDVASDRLRPVGARGIATPEPPAAGQAPAAPAPSGLAPIPKNPNRILSIGKTHNLVHGNDGDLALQLDVQYELYGQAGRDVHVGIWFARANTDTYLESTMRDYADPRGYVTVQTRSARVRSNDARFAATLRIPYRAFPVKEGGEEYDVEARVEVLRTEGQGKVSVLCLGTTTFRVYGGPAEGPAKDTKDAKAKADGKKDPGKDAGAFPEPARRTEAMGEPDAPARDLPVEPASDDK